MRRDVITVDAAVTCAAAAETDDRPSDKQLAPTKPSPVRRQSCVHDVAEHHSSSHLASDDNCTDTRSHATVPYYAQAPLVRFVVDLLQDSSFHFITSNVLQHHSQTVVRNLFCNK